MKKFKNFRKGELGFICEAGSHFNDIDITKLIGYPLFIADPMLLRSDIPYKFYVDSGGFTFYKDMQKMEVNAGIVLDTLENRNKYKLETVDSEPFFQPNLTKPIWNSNYPILTAIHIAYYMGIEPIVLVGLDYDKDLIGSDIEKGLQLAREIIGEIYNASSYTALSYSIIPKISLDIFKDV